MCNHATRGWKKSGCVIYYRYFDGDPYEIIKMPDGGWYARKVEPQFVTVVYETMADAKRAAYQLHLSCR